MRIYLDEDLANPLLARLLAQAGHDVQLPASVGLTGEDDALHLTQAITEQRVLLSGNHDDFERLHHLIAAARGHHHGIVIVRRDNDPRRDLSPRGIVVAMRNLCSAFNDLTDCFFILNGWR
jgi:hypothetical protein